MPLVDGKSHKKILGAGVEGTTGKALKENPGCSEAQEARASSLVIPGGCELKCCSQPYS